MFVLTCLGFLYVDELIKHPSFRNLCCADIQFIVDSNDKKRFTIVEDDNKRLKIRDNQGH